MFYSIFRLWAQCKENGLLELGTLSRCELWEPSIFVGLGGLLTGGGRTGRRDRFDGIFRLLRSGPRLGASAGAGVDMSMRRGARAHRRTPEGSSFLLFLPSLFSSALPNLKSLSVIFSFSNPGQYGQGREGEAGTRWVTGYTEEGRPRLRERSRFTFPY